MSPADLVGPAAEEVSPEDYPDQWGELPLTYEFAPGEPDDGVAADIPLASLNQVTLGGVLLAGTRPARRTGHRADQIPAEAAAHDVRPGP